MNIVVLAGGISTEREISIVSGTQVCKALRGRGHRAVLLDVFCGDGRITEENAFPDEYDVDAAAAYARSFDGQLVISRASSIPSATPAARLEEGDGILLEASATFDATRRFSEYTAATQYGGSECVSGTAQDSGIKIKRPCITVTSDMAQDASQTAKKLCADGIAASTSVSATVSGWRRPDNKRWAERQVVTLKSPSLYLSTEKSWVINSVNYKLSAQDGMTTALTLVPPASFTGSTSGGEIWS